MKNSQNIKSVLALALLTSISTTSAKTISASASGNQYPDMNTAPGSIVNGSFFITDKGADRNIGDGNNEVTLWELDFKNNFTGKTREMRTFLKSNKTLCSAIMSLKIHPGNSNGMKGDVIGIVGLRALGKNLPYRQTWSDTSMTQNIQFDLLDHYSADEINSSLQSYPLGAVQMRYYDDALISGASLMLNYSDTYNCDEKLETVKKLQMNYDFESIIKGQFIHEDQFILGDQFINNDQASNLKSKPVFKKNNSISNKSKFIARASSCLGNIDISMYPSSKKQENQFKMVLTTNKGLKQTYYRSHKQVKKANLFKYVKLTDKERQFKLVQNGDHTFELNYADVATCDIDVIDYATKPPPTKYNGIGVMVASTMLAEFQGHQPVFVARAEEEEEEPEGWDFGPFDAWIDELYEVAEVIGGPNNPYENASGSDGDSDDDSNDGGDDDSDDGSDDDGGDDSYWTAIKKWLLEEH